MKTRSLGKHRSGIWLSMLAFILVQGCTKSNENHAGSVSYDDSSGTSVVDQATDRGVKALRQGHYKQALRAFNAGLQRDITNSALQCLSGMSYHALAKKGDGQYYELAAVAYNLSTQQDPTNWVAYHQLGLLELERRRYSSAK